MRAAQQFVYGKILLEWPSETLQCHSLQCQFVTSASLRLAQEEGSMEEKEPPCQDKGSEDQYPLCCWPIHTGSTTRSVPGPPQPARAVWAEQSQAQSMHDMAPQASTKPPPSQSCPKLAGSGHHPTAPEPAQGTAAALRIRPRAQSPCIRAAASPPAATPASPVAMASSGMAQML